MIGVGWVIAETGRASLKIVSLNGQGIAARGEVRSHENETCCEPSKSKATDNRCGERDALDDDSAKALLLKQ